MNNFRKSSLIEKRYQQIVQERKTHGSSINVEEFYLTENRSEPKQDPLIKNLYSGDIEHYKNRLHSGLYKAIIYLKENFTNKITLNDLSAASYVSPSHLSYLFKVSFNNSFKSILSELRIFYAREEIEKNPHYKITDLALDSGYGDLSHFEKMFKRHAGCSPRVYKRRLQQKL